MGFFFKKKDPLEPGNENFGPGVRRVTAIPILLGLAGLTAFVLIMIWVGFDRMQTTVKKEAAQQKLGNAKMLADDLTRGYSGFIEAILPPAPPPPAEKSVEPKSVPVASSDAPKLDSPPVPPRLEKSPYSEELNRIRALRLQHLEQGLRSKTGVQSGANFPRSSSAPRSSASPSRDEMLAEIANTRRRLAGNNNDDPTKTYLQRLQAVRSSGLIPSDAPPPSGSSLPGGLAGSFGRAPALPRFDGAGSTGDRWLLEGEGISVPRTPFELRAGFIIPAVMISGINSNLPGQVLAQVSQNVYDTATGKYLVIPQGTRLIGTYSSDIGYGQERVMMAWQRLVFPDGKALDIGSMPGADSAGYSGFSDKINNHYFRTFASAFLLSGVVAGINMSQDRSGVDSSNNQRASDAMSEALGQTLGQAMAQMLMKNLSIAPTLEIRPGYRFNVMVVKDIPFQTPYKRFDY